jgi:hypothetical protein
MNLRMGSTHGLIVAIGAKVCADDRERKTKRERKKEREEKRREEKESVSERIPVWLLTALLPEIKMHNLIT